MKDSIKNVLEYINQYKDNEKKDSLNESIKVLNRIKELDKKEQLYITVCLNSIDKSLSVRANMLVEVITHMVNNLHINGVIHSERKEVVKNKLKKALSDVIQKEFFNKNLDELGECVIEDVTESLSEIIVSTISDETPKNVIYDLVLEYINFINSVVLELI